MIAIHDTPKLCTGFFAPVKAFQDSCSAFESAKGGPGPELHRISYGCIWRMLGAAGEAALALSCKASSSNTACFISSAPHFFFFDPFGKGPDLPPPFLALHFPLSNFPSHSFETSKLVSLHLELGSRGRRERTRGELPCK